jgi:hypothetical protein
MSPTRIRAIVDVLMTISSLNEPNGRAIYRREIETILECPLDTPRDPSTSTDLYLLVRGCAQVQGGLVALQTVVDGLHVGSKAAAGLKRHIDEWAYEQRLIGILADCSGDDLLAAIVLVTGVTPPTPQLSQAVQSVGWHVSERWGFPSLLAVADVISAASDDGAEMDGWLVAAAGHLGWGTAELEKLRDTTVTKTLSPRSGTVETADTSRDDPESVVKRITIEDTTMFSPVRGGIPARNLYFTGRDALMQQLSSILDTQNVASMLPEMTLHGYGGVGKTQIAVEYAYRNVDRYRVIWWVAAEHPSAVRAQLSVLAARLGLPSSGSMDQTVRSVLDTLAGTTTYEWLLIYDNADDPASLDGLIPAASPTSGGRVLITSRNPGWAASTPALEVDVFNREESTEMLRKHRPELSKSDANRLAEALGDLPLALEQAVTWLITTLTSVDDYLDEFERRKRVLLNEGKPRHYPNTVLTFVSLAMDRLREEAPVAAQLLELMAFLGPEPISNSLLWEGRRAEITEPLRSALQERNDIARALRDLVRFGVAKADKARRITVHRLVQFVLREDLLADGREDGRRNACRLLAAANPGYPDDRETWPRHAEIRPHARAADLIHGETAERQTVVDQLRYVFNTGDLEGCRDLAVEVLDAWDKPVEEGGRVPDDPLTLLAMRRYADALRTLGDSRAADYAKRALEGLQRTLGDAHEYTMGAVMGVGADLRIAGDFAAATVIDDQNLAKHMELLGPGDPSTLRAMNSVAVNRRWSGDYEGAYELDVEAERQSRTALGDLEAWTFFAIEGQARDLLGLGRYQQALDLQLAFLPDHIALLGEDHLTVLRAQILVASMQRKSGHIAEALTAGRAIYRSLSVRFGAKHGQTLASTVSLANTLRAAGDPVQALKFITEAKEGYRDMFGPRHALTLCAAVSEAVILRALGYDREAMALDEELLPLMREVLGEEHPFTLALLINYGNDLSRAHRLKEALEASSAAWEASIQVRGAHHPYTLHAASNMAIDLIQTGEKKHGESMHADVVSKLEVVYGAGHPETEAARRYRRLECELETPII